MPVYNNTRKLHNNPYNARLKKKFRTLKCAPLQKRGVDEKLKDKTCYTNKLLFKIRDEYNKYNLDNKIISNDPKKIWKQLKKFNKDCNNELCWIRNIDSINKFQIFRPKSPKIWKKKPYTWLSSEDLIKVMRQYEDTYKEFKFIGPSPIDFADKKMFGNCVWEDLCKFSLKDYINKKQNKIGIILNLDPHYKGGSHWVCIFIDIEKRFIFYFDSNGKGPNKRVRLFVKKVLNEAKLLELNFKYYDNRNLEHQKKDGQCGMYTLYVVIKLLRGEKTPKDLKFIRITDEEMKEYREIYFNHI